MCTCRCSAVDPYEADDVRNSCMQQTDETYGDFVGSDMWNAKNPISEDCLYLNVWSPLVDKVDNDYTVSPETLKAVMVRQPVSYDINVSRLSSVIGMSTERKNASLGHGVTFTSPLVFTARCTFVQSAVLRSQVVCLSVRL